jgi:DME family drug/metabolite transporter
VPFTIHRRGPGWRTAAARGRRPRDTIRGVAVLWAVGSALAFSVEGILARGAMGAGGALLATIAARYALAAAVAWAVLLATGRARRLPPADEVALGLGGALGYGGTTTLLFLAFLRIPTALAIVLLYAYPVLVALGGHALGRERLTAWTGAAVAVAVAGVVLVSAPGGGAAVAGVVLALGAAATNAATVLGTEPLLRRTPALAATARLALAAAAATALAAAIAHQARLPPPPAWPAVAGLALGPTLAAVLLLNRSLQAIGATRTAVVATLEPCFAALWGGLFLGERLAGLQWLGALLTVVGATAVSLAPQRRPQAVE